MGKGQDPPLIFQQDDALPRRTAGQFMMPLPVKVGGGVFRNEGVEEHGQVLVQPLVQKGLIQLPGPDGPGHGPVAVPAGGGHLHMGARPNGGDPVVGAPPVGDGEAGKAPPVPQNVLEQGPVLAGVGPVDPVIGGHDGFRLALPHRHLEAGEIELLHGPAVDDAVRVHPQGLLGVDRQMLGAGGDALGLDAPDGGGGQLAREVGILGKILEVPAAQGAPLQVQAGPQQHVDPLGPGLGPHGGAHFLLQRLVPRVCQGGGAGEAGGGQAGVEPQMVGRPGLLPDPGGPVGKGQGRDPQPGDGFGVKLGAPREEGALFFQGHF